MILWLLLSLSETPQHLQLTLSMSIGGFTAKIKVILFYALFINDIMMMDRH